ncbi:hypothetical protein NPIL_487861 [Nephila pilipes]|uniref:Uncharacterized protein n=1 Tax=Nephila pilipes TaxID=299642 RepID=A0A8X6NMP6_NEPPI|nr:hypothetical protein NPIL_487861 [Nephila pilipes]
MFKSGRVRVTRKEGAVRLSTSATDDNISHAREMIIADRRVTTDELAYFLNINHSVLLIKLTTTNANSVKFARDEYHKCLPQQTMSKVKTSANFTGSLQRGRRCNFKKCINR